MPLSLGFEKIKGRIFSGNVREYYCFLRNIAKEFEDVQAEQVVSEIISNIDKAASRAAEEQSIDPTEFANRITIELDTTDNMNSSLDVKAVVFSPETYDKDGLDESNLYIWKINDNEAEPFYIKNIVTFFGVLIAEYEGQTLKEITERKLKDWDYNIAKMKKLVESEENMYSVELDSVDL